MNIAVIVTLFVTSSQVCYKSAMKFHVVYLGQDPLERIISGEKTHEIRLSKKLHAARKTKPGDVLLFRDNATKAISVAALVSSVSDYSGLSPFGVAKLWARYGAETEFSISYWRAKLDSTFAVVMSICGIERLSLERDIVPVGIRSAWLHDFPLPFGFADEIEGVLRLNYPELFSVLDQRGSDVLEAGNPSFR